MILRKKEQLSLEGIKMNSELLPNYREMSSEEIKIIKLIARNLVAGGIRYRSDDSGRITLDEVISDQLMPETQEDGDAFRQEIMKERNELEGGSNLIEYFQDTDTEVLKPSDD